MCCHLLWDIKLEQKACSYLLTKNHWTYSFVIKLSIMAWSIFNITMSPSLGAGGKGFFDFTMRPWDNSWWQRDCSWSHGKVGPPHHHEQVSWSHGETMSYLAVTMRKLMVSPWAYPPNNVFASISYQSGHFCSYHSLHTVHYFSNENHKPYQLYVYKW